MNKASFLITYAACIWVAPAPIGFKLIAVGLFGVTLFTPVRVELALPRRRR